METESRANPLNDDDIHQKLKQLALEAQKYPPLHLKRKNALERLAREILNLKKSKSSLLKHPQRGQWQSNVYNDLYQEALQKTCLDICQKIHNYNPQYPVMAWVNFTLKKHFSEVIKQYRSPKILLISLDEVEHHLTTEKKEQNSEIDLLRQFLEDDPENLLKADHIKDRPDATFQVLAISKFVEGKTWQEMSDCLGISIPTLSSFITRKLHKFRPYFQKYLQE